jgi:hypothetical protein
MGLVTVFTPLITTGAVEFVARTGEIGVVDCKVKPMKEEIGKEGQGASLPTRLG